MKRELMLIALLMLAALATCGAPATAPILVDEPSATVAESVLPTPTPLAAAPTIAPAATETEPGTEPALALTVEEHPVVSDTVDQPTHFEYMERIPPQVLEAHQASRQPAFADKAQSANVVLAPFGYRLEYKPDDGTKPERFDLYKQDELVLADIASLHTPQVSADGKDLAMLVDTMTGPSYLVRPEGGELWDPSQNAFIEPVFAGNDLVTILSVENMVNFEVRRGNETVYEAGPFSPGPENPIKGLSSWDGHWVLELEGEVIVDGKSLNEEKGYDRVFAFHVLRGQPLYFFADEGRVHVSYAGEVLPQEYDQVIHYQCCEASLFNVQANQDMVWFHALRSSTWHYVEMGRY